MFVILIEYAKLDQEVEYWLRIGVLVCHRPKTREG
jgi:hypothetical protein